MIACLAVLLAALPSGAAAAAQAHDAGMKIVNGPRATRKLEDAIVLLEQAVKLEPANSDYLGDYAGTCFELADEERSYRWAVRGRDGMEKTIALNPQDLKAREGLMQFYSMAPWPLGDSDKAVAQAAEIARQNPQMGAKDQILLGGIFEKKGRKALALAAYRAAAKLDPKDPAAAAACRRLAPPP